jgi:hypothetical protein
VLSATLDVVTENVTAIACALQYRYLNNSNAMMYWSPLLILERCCAHHASSSRHTHTQNEQGSQHTDCRRNGITTTINMDTMA